MAADGPGAYLAGFPSGSSAGRQSEVNPAMDSNNALPEWDTIEAWNPIPPWLRLTGLPAVVGPAAMTVFERLLAKYLSRRNMKRKPQTPDGEPLPSYSVPYTQEDLAWRLGYKDRHTISRALKTLEDHHLIERIVTGYQVEGKAVPSWASLNLQLLANLYRLTADAIPQGLDGGGLHGHEVCGYGSGYDVAVRLFQGDPPIRVEADLLAIDWPLGADVRYAEALCADPDGYSDLCMLKRRQVRCMDAVHRCKKYENGETTLSLRTTAEKHVLETADGVDWLPEEVAEYVENVRHRRAS